MDIIMQVQTDTDTAYYIKFVQPELLISQGNSLVHEPNGGGSLMLKYKGARRLHAPIITALRQQVNDLLHSAGDDLELLHGLRQLIQPK